MTDLDRLLRQSLSAAAATYQPTDAAIAWQRVRSRRRRRNVVYALSAAVVAGTALFAVAMIGRGDVLRDARPDLAPVRPAPGSPSPEASPASGSLDPDMVLFVYSASGDIRAQTTDGSVVRLTSGAERDVHPTIARDGRTVVFERTSPDNGQGPVLVHLDLESGEERELATGSWPSFAPDGRIAWVRPADAELNEIVVSRPFEDDEFVLQPLPDYSDVRHITWAPDSAAVYYEAGRSIVQHFVDDAVEPFPMTPGGITDGRGAVALVAPTMRHEDRVEVLHLCCRDDQGGPFALTIGSIAFTEGGPLYEPIVPVDPRSVVPAAQEHFMAYAGRLTVTGPAGSGRWSTDGEHEAWLVSDGESLYLIDEEGNHQFVSDLPGHEGETGTYAGIAVRSQLDS